MSEDQAVEVGGEKYGIGGIRLAGCGFIGTEKAFEVGGEKRRRKNIKKYGSGEIRFGEGALVTVRVSTCQEVG